MRRVLHYDVLRGLAISCMLMANAVPYIYPVIPPLVMRIIGSFAAPSFMLLSGMMLALAKQPKLARGWLLIVIGCWIDIAVWQLAPLMTCDVLYTLGVGILITAYPARNFPIAALWIGASVFLFIAECLRAYFGYQTTLLVVELPPQISLPIATLIIKSVRQWLIEGWFPLFPWLSFIWFGAAWQRSIAAAQITKLKYGALFVFGIAASVWWRNFVIPPARMEYTELFYPADWLFAITYASAAIVILLLLEYMLTWPGMARLLAPLAWLGQQALGLYVLHLIIIRGLYAQQVVATNLHEFLGILLLLWLGLVLVSKVIQHYRLGAIKTINYDSTP